MDLAEALYRTFTDRSPRTEPTTLAGMVDALRPTFGVKPPPGISERTWRRLRKGEVTKPTKPTMAALRRAQRAVRVTAGRARLLRGTPIIGVHAIVIISSDDRERKVIISAWGPGHARGANAGDQEGVMRDVLDKWLRGDDHGATGDLLDYMTRGLTGYSPRNADQRITLGDVKAVRVWPPGPKGGASARRWTDM